MLAMSPYAISGNFRHAALNEIFSLIEWGLIPRGIADDPRHPRRTARRRLMSPGASTFDKSKVEAVSKTGAARRFGLARSRPGFRRR
jgi:hypothetical protein